MMCFLTNQLTYTINFSDLLANDSDADGDNLSVTNITLNDGSKGTLSNIDYTAGTASFTFASNVVTSTSFSYEISDGTTTSSSNLQLNYLPSVIALSSLNGNNGFTLNGIQANDWSGASLSSAGDMNNDGYDDIIIGAYGATRDGKYRVGETYVVFGKENGYSASLDLSSLNGTNGFKIEGIGDVDYSSQSVSNAGDINGDGFDDIIIGAYLGDADATDAGESYVVFGKASGYSASFDLSSLNGSNGFRIDGIDAGDESGFFVSSAGDMNNDGYDDLIIGAPQADPNSNSNAGESYVVFGKANGYSASFDLSSLNGSNGFKLNGIDTGDKSGSQVSSIGDVNGDGYDDIIIGAYSADNKNGESYVVFGKANGYATSFNLSSLNGTNGFKLTGISDGDNWSAHSINNAGDINGDGYNDIIMGSYLDDASKQNNGQTYVIFGKGNGWLASMSVSSLNGSNGFVIDGMDAGDNSGYLVSSAGDFNGDGFDDIIMGAWNADPDGRTDAGESYIIFGKATGYTKSFDLSAINGQNGIRIDGVDAFDRASVVSLAGDVNDDGFDDIIIGAAEADPNGKSSAGESYVVFGYDNNFSQSQTQTGTLIDDKINGGAVNDTSSGGDGDDIIHGGNGDDKITGGDGNDKLDGGYGNDKLDGGYGNDQFIFNNGDDSDIILDFEDGKDKIDLSNYTKSDGSKIAFNDLSITKSGGDTKITGLDAGDEILVRNISDTNITADDFMFGA